MSVVLYPEGIDPELVKRVAQYDGTDEVVRQMIEDGRAKVYLP